MEMALLRLGEAMTVGVMPFTEEMFKAYKGALRAWVASVPEAERPHRWQTRGYGYRLSEREKAEARWKAMFAVFTAANHSSTLKE